MCYKNFMTFIKEDNLKWIIREIEHFKEEWGLNITTDENLKRYKEEYDNRNSNAKEDETKFI